MINKLNKAEVPKNVDVVVAPTLLHIDLVQRLLTNSSIEVSAQNSVQFGPGAYTGEIAPELLADFGVNWVILGHSERRQVFHTDDDTVGKQVAKALSSGLKVIACVGETLQERESNETMKVIERQMQVIADNVQDWSKVVIAYEPVWAIGTGKVSQKATQRQAAQTETERRGRHNDRRSKLFRARSPQSSACLLFFSHRAYSNRTFLTSASSRLLSSH